MKSNTVASCRPLSPTFLPFKRILKMMPSNKCSHHTDQTIQQLTDRTDLYNAPTRCTFYESILENMLKLFITFFLISCWSISNPRHSCLICWWQWLVGSDNGALFNGGQPLCSSYFSVGWGAHLVPSAELALSNTTRPLLWKINNEKRRSPESRRTSVLLSRSRPRAIWSQTNPQPLRTKKKS